jgi:hypothetical protein
MKKFALFLGMILGVFALILITAFAAGTAPGGLAAGLPVLFIGLLVLSLAMDKPGPIQETDCSISGKRLAAFILIGVFAGIFFKFGYVNLTVWPAVILLALLLVVALVFGMTTWVDIKELLKIAKADKGVAVSQPTSSSSQ